MSLSILLLVFFSFSKTSSEFTLIEAAYYPIIYGKPCYDKCNPLIPTFSTEYSMIAYSYKFLELSYILPISYCNFIIGISPVELSHEKTLVLPVRLSFNFKNLSSFLVADMANVRKLRWKFDKYGIKMNIFKELSLEVGKQEFFFPAHEELTWVGYFGIIAQIK